MVIFFIYGGTAVRKILTLLICILFISSIISFGNEKEYENKKVYYVDSQIFNLIGVSTQITKTDSQSQAEELIKQLIRGHDENSKIKRVIPNKKGVLKVKIRNNTAYVDINKKVFSDNSREIEKLVIYSIVNTLTGVDGVDVVRFTVDGKTTKKFMGYLDMREAFIPNYI